MHGYCMVFHPTYLMEKFVDELNINSDDHEITSWDSQSFILIQWSEVTTFPRTSRLLQ